MGLRFRYLTYTEFQPLKLAWLNSTTRWAMKTFGQWWKRMHRLVYGASVLAAAYAVRETSR